MKCFRSTYHLWRMNAYSKFKYSQARHCYAGINESQVTQISNCHHGKLKSIGNHHQPRCKCNQRIQMIWPSRSTRWNLVWQQWYDLRFYTLRPRTVQGFNLGHHSANFLELKQYKWWWPANHDVPIMTCKSWRANHKV